uniref:Uncharacterized protein n=1 Tax=Wuchereria bancrofti TaxID=6293 RepID=A0AAF5PJR0_WUCBA
MSSEASCSGFEPQIYLRERCKNSWREERRSWRDKTTTVSDNGASEHVAEDIKDDTISHTSHKSAKLKDISSKNHQKISGTKRRAIIPVENDLICQLLFYSKNFDTTIMKAEIAHLREKVFKLKEEQQKWTIRKLVEAQSCIQDYHDENTVLEYELRELQKCESSSDSRNKMNIKLAEKLEASESLCDELMDENEL